MTTPPLSTQLPATAGRNRVLAVFVPNEDEHLISLGIDIGLDGDDVDLLTATAEHPLWVIGKGWTFATDPDPTPTPPRPGDSITTGDA